MVLLARKDEEGNTQALYDHLHGAGRLASGFEDEFADISRTAAVLHDVGKVAQQFQTYLLSDDGHRGDVQHARQGAFVVNDFFESKGEIEEIAKEILELAISKHHGGLPDCIDESGNRAFLLGFTESDKSNEKYAYQEIKRGLNGLALDLQSNFRGSAEDIACLTGNQAIVVWAIKRPEEKPVLNPQSGSFDFDHVSGEHLGVKRKRFLKRIIATTDFCNYQSRFIAYK